MRDWRSIGERVESSNWAARQRWSPPISKKYLPRCCCPTSSRRLPLNKRPEPTNLHPRPLRPTRPNLWPGSSPCWSVCWKSVPSREGTVLVCGRSSASGEGLTPPYLVWCAKRQLIVPQNTAELSFYAFPVMPLVIHV